MKKTIIYVITLLLLPAVVWSAPSITGSSGTLSHGNSFTLTGSGFGSKSSAAPVAYGDMENNSVNARIGSWSDTGILSVSTSHPRHSNSAYSAVAHFTDQDQHGSFTGGSDAARWYVQYWFYLESGWTWSGDAEAGFLGNCKVFRMWSTGSETNNCHIGHNGTFDVINYCEGSDANHNWNPVVSGYSWVDLVMGHSDPGYVDPAHIGWKQFEYDWTVGTWHLFQWEWVEGTQNGNNGVNRWWFDGKLVFDRTDYNTKGASETANKRPCCVGFYNSHGTGSAYLYLDDAYIDNTLQRVEIGNNATYNSCTHKEIQPATSWADGSVTFTVNRGSFGVSDTAYVFVTDASGVRNTGYSVTFGAGGGDTTAPTVTFTTSSPQTITTDSLTVTGTASDAVGVTSCKYRVGSEPGASAGTACTGTTSWSCATSGFSSGSNSLYVECVDAIPNWSTGHSITVYYDPSPRNASNVSFTNSLPRQ